MFLLFVVLTLFSIEPAIAQEPIAQPFRMEAGIGCSFAGYRDEVESPINRYFNALTFQTSGAIEKGDFLHSFGIGFFKGNPEMATPYKGYSHKRYISVKASMEYALDYRLRKNETFPFFLGGAFRTVGYYTGTDGKDGEDIALPTGYGLVSLDLHATQKWIINAKNMLILSAGCPIFGYAVRPAYTGMDELWAKYLYENPFKIATLGNITSFHNYWAVSGDLEYYYKCTKLFSPYAGLGFELSRINFPRPRTDAIFRLNAGIAFTF